MKPSVMMRAVWISVLACILTVVFVPVATIQAGALCASVALLVIVIVIKGGNNGRIK